MRGRKRAEGMGDFPTKPINKKVGKVAGAFYIYIYGGGGGMLYTRYVGKVRKERRERTTTTLRRGRRIRVLRVI